jgi:hypothetical protein
VPLGPKELRITLSRISEGDGDELFAAAGMNWISGISLASFFHKLVDVSPESILWELRCRLICAGLWHNDSLKMTELLQHVPPRVDEPTSGSVSSDTSAVHELQLSHDDWVKFCLEIDLTAFEANRLYHMLRDERNCVATDKISHVLRQVLGPDISIMELAASLLEHFGSLQHAFTSACRSKSHTMCSSEFHKMLACFKISSRNVRRLWVAIKSLIPVSHNEIGEVADEITEDEFVNAMVPWTPDMLSWTGNTALQSLEQQICENFSSLADFRRAMRQHGLPGGLEISPERLRQGLAVVGCLSCDAHVVLSKASAVAGLSSSSQVTLDDVIEALRTSWQQAHTRGHDAMEKDGMRVWQHLHDETRWKHSRQVSESRARSKTFVASPAPSARSASVEEHDESSRSSSKLPTLLPQISPPVITSSSCSSVVAGSSSASGPTDPFANVMRRQFLCPPMRGYVMDAPMEPKTFERKHQAIMAN